VKRIPEPELMDEPRQALAYARADFEEPNARFVETFDGLFPDFRAGLVLDLGCGPGDIALRFARRYRRTAIAAVDGSGAMLRLARRAARSEGLETRVRFLHWRIGARPVPPELAGRADAVISNSLLHHMANPAAFWAAIRDCARPGAKVLVMDLARPRSPEAARRIVAAYSGAEPPVLKRDFFASLHAAWRIGEVRAQLRAAGLELSVERASDRHWIAHGHL
jgi:SAM-dependent methyltransferase